MEEQVAQKTAKCNNLAPLSTLAQKMSAIYFDFLWSLKALMSKDVMMSQTAISDTYMIVVSFGPRVQTSYLENQMYRTRLTL